MLDLLNFENLANRGINGQPVKAKVHQNVQLFN